MNNLKQVIDSEGLTQVELSKISNVSIGTLSRIVNNKITPTARLKNKIVKAINSHLNTDKYLLLDIFSE